MAAAGVRLRSVDALRGISVAAMLVVNDAGDWGHVHPWLDHAEWHGFTPPDLVFPLFLFLVGVSMSLGLVPQLERGVAPRALLAKALGRAARLVALGLVLQLVAGWTLTPDHAFRVFGVLQRIGLASGAAAALVLHAQSTPALWLRIVALLALHAALLLGGGTLAPGLNFADRVDAMLLGPHAYRFDAATGQAHDPEGPLGTLGAVATVLLGVRAGAVLRRDRIAKLVIGAILALAAGLAMQPWLPVNKHLWTGSFVLVTAGLSAGLLALAHVAFDRAARWVPGEVLGRQAITAYALGWLATCAVEGSGAGAVIYRRVFEDTLVPTFEPWVASAAYAVAFTGVVASIVIALDRAGWRATI